MEHQHTCPIAWAFDHGLADDAHVSRSWCWNTYRTVVEQLPDPMNGGDVTNERLQLWKEDRLRVYYTPFDWVNINAKLLLVGITPGRSQALAALRTARHGLRDGLQAEELLSRVDANASFSGPMRTNLVSMLDGIGVAGALGITSSSSLFETEHHDLAGLCSAISFPVFLDGENYRGAPSLTRTPSLRALLTALLGATIAMSDDPLIIPLGKAAAEAVDYLVASGLAKPGQVLDGFPHPSGANGHRPAQYQSNREHLALAVGNWFAQRPTS